MVIFRGFDLSYLWIDLNGIYTILQMFIKFHHIFLSDFFYHEFESNNGLRKDFVWHLKILNEYKFSTKQP